MEILIRLSQATPFLAAKTRRMNQTKLNKSHPKQPYLEYKEAIRSQKISQRQLCLAVKGLVLHRTRTQIASQSKMTPSLNHCLVLQTQEDLVLKARVDLELQTQVDLALPTPICLATRTNQPNLACLELVDKVHQICFQSPRPQTPKRNQPNTKSQSLQLALAQM